MSKAFKCDVCQKCFSPVDFGEEQHFAFINEIMIRTKSDYQRGVRGTVHSEFHFCPECTTKLSNFLQGEEIEHDISTDLEVVKIVDEIERIPASVLYSMRDAIEREIGRRFDERARDFLYGDSRISEGPGEAPQRKKRAEKNGE